MVFAHFVKSKALFCPNNPLGDFYWCKTISPTSAYAIGILGSGFGLERMLHWDGTSWSNLGGYPTDGDGWIVGIASDSFGWAYKVNTTGPTFFNYYIWSGGSTWTDIGTGDAVNQLGPTRPAVDVAGNWAYIAPLPDTFQRLVINGVTYGAIEGETGVYNQATIEWLDSVNQPTQYWGSGAASSNGGFGIPTPPGPWMVRFTFTGDSPYPYQQDQQLLVTDFMHRGKAAAIWIAPSGNVWSAGYLQVDAFPLPTAPWPVVWMWDGTWTTLYPPIPATGVWAELSSISGIGDDDIWVVGTWGRDPTSGYVGENSFLYTAHWDGTSWTHVPQPLYQGKSVFNDVSVAASDDVWAVGFACLQWYASHWDGSTWTPSIIPSM